MCPSSVASAASVPVRAQAGGPCLSSWLGAVAQASLCQGGPVTPTAPLTLPLLLTCAPQWPGTEVLSATALALALPAAPPQLLSAALGCAVPLPVQPEPSSESLGHSSAEAPSPGLFRPPWAPEPAPREAVGASCTTGQQVLDLG